MWSIYILLYVGWVLLSSLSERGVLQPNKLRLADDTPEGIAMMARHHK